MPLGHRPFAGDDRRLPLLARWVDESASFSTTRKVKTRVLYGSLGR
jgi:hypothetical protein